MSTLGLKLKLFDICHVLADALTLWFYKNDWSFISIIQLDKGLFTKGWPFFDLVLFLANKKNGKLVWFNIYSIPRMNQRPSEYFFKLRENSHLLSAEMSEFLFIKQALINHMFAWSFNNQEHKLRSENGPPAKMDLKSGALRYWCCRLTW